MPVVHPKLVSAIIAFDSKEFNVKGVFKDFFCPLGMGVTIRDEHVFHEAYCKAIEASASRHHIKQKRPVFDSYTLARILGGLDSAADFYETLIGDLRPHIEHVHVFYTMIPPRKVPKVFMYGVQTEVRDPVDFLKEHKAGYVVLCAWKYLQTVPEEKRSESMYLDFFEAKRTRAWDAIEPAKPQLFIRGDTCNPCVAMADGLLAVMDRQLKRNYYLDGMKLSDRSINHALRTLSIRGDPVFIGQPDLRKIVPYSRDQVVTADLVRRPIYFLCPEKRPEGMDNPKYREMIEFMPVMDKIVQLACRDRGCIKFYDHSQDYLLAREGDHFAFFGEIGRGMCESLRKHVAVAPLDLSPKESRAQLP